MSGGGLMMERTRTAWRAVRDAGIEGATRDDINAAMTPKKYTRPEIEASVRNLKQLHYIRSAGRMPDTRWFVTGKIPVGESLDMNIVGMVGLDAPANLDPDDDSSEELFGKREAPQGVPKGVPSSVFALGDMAARLAGETVADVLAEASGQVTAAAAAVTAAAPGLNWTSAPAPAPTPAPAAAPAPAAMADLRPSITQRMQADESPSQALQRLCVQAGLLPIGAGVPREPLFTLRSDNVLLIDACADGQFALNPNVTRALFRWLDRLGGTDLVRLTEQTS